MAEVQPVLDLGALESIRADCFADDLDIDVERMSLWTEEQARQYFESGGEEEPTPPAASASCSQLESPGAVDMARRVKVRTLPAQIKMSMDELKRKAPLTRPGEWYALPFPTTLAKLDSAEFGASWLTKAFHKAGSLPADDAVTSITRVHELELQGIDAQGGAGHKAIVEVTYSNAGNGLHTTLFVKMPWRMEVQPKYRMLISVAWGDLDASELSIYQFYEGLLPVRIPKLYFADICRETTNYVLITECILYPPRSRAAEAFPLRSILPKCGKYQDDTLGAKAAEYYFALLRACARIGAADKLGRFDSVAGTYAWEKPRGPPDTTRRREMMAGVAGSQADILIDFVSNVARGVFPPSQVEPAFLERFKAQLVEMAPFFTAANAYVASDERYIGLTHINLQIDNGYFWQEEEGGRLECGLLDWGGATRLPYTSTFMGMLSGAEAEVLYAHEEGLMRCFADEYAACGGPQLDVDELLLRFRLSYAGMVLGALQYIEQDIYPECSRADFETISTRWDPKLMGRWNARCRTIAILCMLGFWEKHDLHGAVMGWAKKMGLRDGKFGYPPVAAPA